MICRINCRRRICRLLFIIFRYHLLLTGGFPVFIKGYWQFSTFSVLISSSLVLIFYTFGKLFWKTKLKSPHDVPLKPLFLMFNNVLNLLIQNLRVGKVNLVMGLMIFKWFLRLDAWVFLFVGVSIILLFV